MKILMVILALLVAAPAWAQQKNEDLRITQDKRILRASNTALSVPASGNTILLDLDVRDIERIYVQVAPTTNGFDAFIVSIQPHNNGAYSTIASAAADYTSPAGIMVGASGDLTTLAAAATGWVILDTRGLARVRVQASGSGGASTVTAVAGGY